MTRWTAGLALAGLAALSACDDEPAPTPVDERAPAEVIRAVLDRCQGQRLGSFSRSQLELIDPTGASSVATLDLPRRVRIDGPGGQHYVLDGDVGWVWTTDRAPWQLEGRELADARSSRELLGMLVLHPLESATDPRCESPGRISFAGADGVRFTLQYDPATDDPLALEGPAGTVRFTELLDTGRLHVPKVVEFGSHGPREVRFIETAFRFEDRFFRPPARDDRPPDLVLGGSLGSETARLVDVEPQEWLMMPDPGDWPGRVALFEAVAERLGPKGYTNAGDPILLEEDGTSWFVVPFRSAGEKTEAVTTGEGERLRHVDAHRAAAVEPPDGNWSERVAAGRKALESLLTEHGLKAGGATRVAVNLFGVTGGEEPVELRSTPLRVAVPIAP